MTEYCHLRTQGRAESQDGLPTEGNGRNAAYATSARGACAWPKGGAAEATESTAATGDAHEQEGRLELPSQGSGERGKGERVIVVM